MERTDPPATREAPLRGRGIAVTRPAGQGDRLAKLIAQAGGTPIVFPLIEIRPVADPSAARERFARLHEYELVVFVSANAVEHGFALMARGASHPSGMRIAAVGRGTARALAARGVPRVLVPDERYDSEGLLALPELSEPAGKRVLVVRGVGGRELLADTLLARGARVDYAECYERGTPSTPPAVLLDAWRDGVLHAVTITSSEALRNLHALLDPDGRAHLAATPLFVTHPRMRETANALGLHDVVMAEAGDEGLYAALVHHYRTAR